MNEWCIGSGVPILHILLWMREKGGFWGFGEVGSSMGVGFLGFVNPTSMPNWVSRVHPRDLWFFVFLNNFFLGLYLRALRRLNTSLTPFDFDFFGFRWSPSFFLWTTCFCFFLFWFWVVLENSAFYSPSEWVSEWVARVPLGMIVMSHSNEMEANKLRTLRVQDLVSHLGWVW